jgi:hypothetical protein
MARMKPFRFSLALFAMLAATGFSVCAQNTSAANATARILMPDATAKLMPPSVFFRGQTAPVQMRNTYGLQFGDGMLILAGLVDSSGYSSGVQQKYQGYLLTEVPLTIEGKTLPAGAYGFGFIAPHSFLVMDIGAHEVMHVDFHTDPKIARPRPLSIAPSGEPRAYRLIANRRYVTVQRK